MDAFLKDEAFCWFGVHGKLSQFYIKLDKKIIVVEVQWQIKCVEEKV